MIKVEQIETAVIEDLCEQLADEAGVQAELPGGGWLYIERPLPYLCVYWLPTEHDYALRQIGRTEASYLMVPSGHATDYVELLACVARTLSETFGAIMILEIWSDPHDKDTSPRAMIYGPGKDLPFASEQLKENLQAVRVGYRHLLVEEAAAEARYPDDRPTLFSGDDQMTSEILVIGIRLQPFYLDPHTREIYPLVLRSFRQQFSVALRKTFFEFIRLQTNYGATHFHMLGPTRLDEWVQQVDDRMEKIARQFKFLLLVTPTNIAEAWEQFQADDYRKDPTFHYRLLPVDPEKIKRELYNIPIEKISDPTLAFLFRDKRDELDKMLTMLRDRGSEHFVYSSMQLYGGVDEATLDIAEGLLTAITVDHSEIAQQERVQAVEFAQRAQEELHFLKRQYPQMDSDVQIRSDVSGLIVSDGVLCINDQYSVRADRVEALIQHEVGTHVLTYQNGKAQPLQQLYSGVPGYETLQEGLAVLAEYLVDGLTNSRLRILAARVVGVHRMISGASFCETYYLLTSKYQFPPRTAFTITMRIYRGGGLTKDAVYLRGLIEVLDYLKKGNELEDLLIGKIRVDYIPIMQELIHRRILKPVPLRPRYMLDERFNFQEKCARLRAGINVFHLIRY